LVYALYSTFMLCPICHSSQVSYFATKSNYVFFRCIECKTIFLKKLPTAKDLHIYYKKNFSYSDGLINEKTIRNQAHLILKALVRIAPKAKTLCDVGSGFGFFLDEARKDRYVTIGIEPSRKIAELALKKLGIISYVGSLEEYISLHKKQFDIVTCIHVIEHVQNPKQFIQNLLKLVKSGGILYLETPNSDSHLLYIEKGDYTFLIPPDHLWIFSIHSVLHFLSNKVELIKINTYSYPEHFMGIVKQAIKKTKSKTSSQKPNYSNILRPSSFKKKLSYILFDCIIAPLFTGILNLYHKGSILELYIRKK